VNTRAHDFVVLMLGVLGAIGPSTLGASVHRFLTWDLVQIVMATDHDLRALAEDRGLDERTIVKAGEVWWHQAAGRRGRAHVVARGPNHQGPPPIGTAEEW
jgi:hypothetical protein